MAWTGDVARVHCDVISAETYLQNAIAVVKGMKPSERPRTALGYLETAVAVLQDAQEDLSRGVSPEVLDMLRGTVIPLEGP